MDYFYYMDEPTRGWKESNFQDVGIPRPFNSLGSMYHEQEDYEIEEELIDIPKRFEGP